MAAPDAREERGSEQPPQRQPEAPAQREIQAIEALYYPQVEFPSAAWVKSSLLYWEGLLRIVPDGREPDDPPEIKELVEAGVVQNLSPAPFRKATSDAFGPRLEELLHAREGKSIEDEWACAGPRDGGNLVHLTQIEHVLTKELEKKHLLTAAGEWARMSPAVARLYQITMANEAAQQLYAAPVTDSPSCDVASTYFAFEKVAADPRSIPPDGLQFAQMYMPYPSQKAAERISIDRLLDVRQKYQRRRRQFRETIQKRTAAIATLPSAEAIRSHLEGLAKELQEQLEMELEALRASKLKDAWTLFGITAPLTLGSAGSLAGGPAMLAAVGAFGAVGIGTLGWYLEKRLKRRTEGSYLLALGQELDGHKRVTDMRERMSRFLGSGKK